MHNICFLLGGFQGNGGIGRVTSILANELCKNNDYQVITIAYCQTNAPMLYNISDEIKQCFLYDNNVSMAKALLLKHAVRKVKNIIKRQDIDILIACGALYFPLGIWAVRGTKVKCYCWEHTKPSVSTDYKFQNYCRKVAVKKADKLIVLTKAAEKYYKEHFRLEDNRICQIYNPVGKEALQSETYNKDSKKIISVGRLTYPKNFDLLIDIAAEIFPLYPDWSWDIYGSGDLEEALRQKIKTYNLNEKINLKGEVSDLYHRYKEYSFMVMTSRYEGFPMSLIEGGANRLPLISFDIETGPNEIIDDGINGFLIPPEDKELMIKKIQELIKNEKLRECMSVSVFEKVQLFNLEKIMMKWCEICSK